MKRAGHSSLVDVSRPISHDLTDRENGQAMCLDPAFYKQTSTQDIREENGGHF